VKKDLSVEPNGGKRQYQRYKHGSLMHLYRMDYQDQYYHAQMIDYSQGGMAMLTNERLVVGQIVYLEMKKYDEGATGPEKYKSYSGSVKWASPYASSQSDADGSYNYGIEYFESTSYPC